jgi:hypothetical protein
MEIIFFILWVIGILICVLIIPISDRVEKLDDGCCLKQWWKNHIVNWDPYDKSK